MAERYYTTKELTEYFRISRFALLRATKSGTLKVAKVDGRKNLYSAEDVKRYIEHSGSGEIASK